MTYLTNCGDSSCADFDPTDAEWFKIEEAGKTDGTWAQAALSAYLILTEKNTTSDMYCSEWRDCRCDHPKQPRCRQLPHPPRDNRAP